MSPAGAAAAREPPGASAPGWDPGTAPAWGGHPGFCCDPARPGLGGVGDTNPRGLSACQLRQCRGLGKAVPWAALCQEEQGWAAPRDAPAKSKPGACSPGGSPSPRALVGGWGFPHARAGGGGACQSQLGTCRRQSGHVWVILSIREQISSPKGLSSQIIPRAHASSTQTRDVWCKVPVPREPSGAPRSQGWRQLSGAPFDTNQADQIPCALRASPAPFLL